MNTPENIPSGGIEYQLSLWLVKKLSVFIDVKESEIRLDEPVAQYGLDSLQALAIAGELEDMLGIELPPTMLWEYPTIEKITLYLYEALKKNKQIN